MTESALLDRVRRRLAASPASDVEDVLRGEPDLLADDATIHQLRARIDAELQGAGPLEPLLSLPGVTDVLVNAPGQVWFDRGRGLERSELRFEDDAAIRRLAQRLAAGAGRRLDDASPFVDVVLSDGTRLHAALPPVVAHPTLSMRVLGRARLGLDDLVQARMMTAGLADLMRSLIESGVSLVIAGGTGTGKTTLLGALLDCVPHAERVLLLEDVREVVCAHPHLVRLVARTANVEGAGSVDLRDLVRQAMRMRPDRIVVGEFRGAEVSDLLSALNTGHPGGLATVHANSVGDLPARFAALGSLAGLDRLAIAEQVASAFQLTVQLRRGRGGRRLVCEVGVIELVTGQLHAVPAVTMCGPGPGADRLRTVLAERGVARTVLPRGGQ